MLRQLPRTAAWTLFILAAASCSSPDSRDLRAASDDEFAETPSALPASEPEPSGDEARLEPGAKSFAASEPLLHLARSRTNQICGGDGCEDGDRQIYSNLSDDDLQRRLTEIEDERLALAATLPRTRLERFERADLARTTAAVLELARQRIAEGASDELVTVTIHVEGPKPDFTLLRGLRSGPDADPERVQQIVDGWRAELGPAQDAISERVAHLGGEVQLRHLTSPAVTARVPQRQLEELLSSDGVLGIETTGAPISPNGSGIARRLSIGLDEDAMAPKLSGGTPGATRSSGARVVYGVMESMEGHDDSGVSDNSLPLGLTSFKQNATGGSRVLSRWRCVPDRASGQCSPDNTNGRFEHGAAVSSIILADLEDNQDPTVTTTNAQRNGGGIAGEAVMHYYAFLRGPGLYAAIQRATLWDGVDIINISASPGASPTAPACTSQSYSGVREAIQAAADAGILVIVSAGNNGLGNSTSTGWVKDAASFPEGCSVNAFGVFPDTLAVGNTTADNLVNLATATPDPMSSYGTRTNYMVGGRPVQTPFVDLMTNGPTMVYQGGYPDYPIGSTSAAAPIVSGAAGLLKEWVSRRGTTWVGENPQALRTLLFLMGDGASNSGGNGFGQTIDAWKGFGHLRFIDLDDEIGSGGWGLEWRTIVQGEVIEWPVGGSGPESTNIKGWKFAALVDGPPVDAPPDITFQLIDKCPSGGGTAVIRTAASQGLKARMRMLPHEMSTRFHNRCLYLRATAHHMNGSAQLYTANYSYTNDRINHDM